jgi:6-phosphogluconolactonase
MAVQMGDKSFLYVSSWVKKNSVFPTGGGIHVFEVNYSDGSLIHVADYCDEMSAGYICISPDKRFLYALDETKRHSPETPYGGNVTAFSIDRDNGGLTLLNTRPSVGVFPNYMAIDATGSYVVVTNYGSEDVTVRSTREADGKYRLLTIDDESSVVLLPIKKDGSLGDVCELVRHTDEPSMVNQVYQTCPHPHSVNVDNLNRYALVCDRGCDKIIMYRFDSAQGKLTACDSFTTSRGTGPRNSVFHPTLPHFFVASELQPKVAAYSYDISTGKIKQINMIATIPDNYQPPDPNDFRSCSHPSDIRIHKNGKFLYVSNRGHNSIARFSIHEATGELTYIGTTSTQGETPRAFNLDSNCQYLYVGNQETGNLVVYEINSDTGDLAPTGFVAYAQRPVCIVAL